MINKKLTNQRISGQTGALAVLKEIDFERIRDSGLQTKVAIYLAARDSTTNPRSVIYRGPITLEDSHSLSSVGPTNILLPKATYKEGSRIFEGVTPAWTILKKPAKYEFFITADSLRQYDGLFAFRDTFLPAMFEAGYGHPNTDHTSEFWLYFARRNLNKAEPTLSINPYEGLKIHQRNIDEVMVISDLDSRRLLELGKEKPVAYSR